MKIFSQTYEKNRTRKIINILGIKLKFKTNRVNNKIIIVKKDGTEKCVKKIPGCKIKFTGKNAVFKIHEPFIIKNCSFTMHSNSIIEIKPTNPYGINSISADLGENSRVYIGQDFSCVAMRLVTFPEHNLTIRIGDNCMFNDVYIRASDGHTIYNTHTHKIQNIGKDIYIGNHVWLCKDVLVLKGAHISDNTIVGARAIVNTKHETSGCILGGVPARVVKTDVNWDRRGQNCFDGEEWHE